MLIYYFQGGFQVCTFFLFLSVIHLEQVGCYGPTLLREGITQIYLLRVWVAQYKPDVVTLSETCLHCKICDDDIKLNISLLYRADRSTRGGGGMIYVSSNITSECAIPKVNTLNVYL